MSLLVERVLGLVLRVGPPQVGWRAYGVPPGGPFDAGAAARARLASGAELGATVLEVANAVFEAEFQVASVLAWSGATALVKLDGMEVPAGVPQAVSVGARLSVGPSATGLRTYLSVAGGFGDAPLEASWVRAGEVLPVGASASSGRPVIEPEGADGPIWVTPGPQGRQFRCEWLTETPWTVSPQSNRVGLRLEGVATEPAPEMVSEPACFGTIQVDASGLPIVLGPDGPTIGGYAKVAVVREADLDRLAQLRPGDAVWFAWD